MEQKHYRLTLTEKQIHAISNACELLSRIYIGQLERVADQYMDHPKYHELHALMQQAHEIVTGIKNGGPGIFNRTVNNEARVAWEIYGTIRQFIAYERQPEGGHSVYFRDPLHESGEVLPQMERSDGAPDPRPTSLKMAK